MAFNFNWSPLIADTVRAREMLTNALNKSPKPAIIVDDIVVTELNLGKIPPDLEILEIGDLAEDRFRGIFKMTYSGDAFLTLKTRVQANPLNTYLSTKPTFASPQPLAAASGMTIPLQITLSDINLSGFVILVFSRQKGLTLVFRNDPLESLKVSSTFDSISFVRDYLQKEIEGQLRVLFMEDLPAILHKLSLRLWSPDYCDPSDPLFSQKDDSTIPIDPLASPIQDPVDWLLEAFGDDSIPSLSLNRPTESHATFSSKNLLRLASLTESQRTLSLFTPSIRDVVYRAWAGSSEHSSGTHTPSMPVLSRLNSAFGSASSAPSVASGAESEPSMRPNLSTSSSYSYTRSAGGRTRGQRKKKHRVIDLRKPKTDDSPDETGGVTQSTTPEPSIAPSSAPSIMLENIHEESPRSPSRIRFRQPAPTLDGLTPPSSSRNTPARPSRASKHDAEVGPPPAYTLGSDAKDFASSSSKTADSKSSRPSLKSTTSMHPAAMPTRPNHFRSNSAGLLRSLSADRIALNRDSSYSSNGSILEHTWMMKMAREIARTVDQKREMERGQNLREGREKERMRSEDVEGDGSSTTDASEAPPAYAF
jgi:distribution and morphology protein 34